MKKRIFLIGLLVCLLVSACGSKNETPSNNDEDVENVQQDGEDEEDMQEESPETDNEDAEQESETIYNIGETATLKDWEVTVTDMQIVESISTGYIKYTPDEDGDRYIQVFVTAVNNGKQANRFLPTVGIGDDVKAKIIYGDGYEFSGSILLGYDNDMHDSTVNPLSSQTGEIVFSVPETVHSSEDEIQIHFISGKDTVKFKIR